MAKALCVCSGTGPVPHNLGDLSRAGGGDEVGDCVFWYDGAYLEPGIGKTLGLP